MINILSIGDNAIIDGEVRYMNNTLSFVTVTEPLKAFNSIIKSPPDIIIIDMTDEKLDSQMVFERIRRIQASKTIPVVLITRNEDDPEFRRLLQDGVTKALSRPDKMDELYYKILRILNIHAGDVKKKVLIVDDDPAILDTARMYLDAQYEVITKLSGKECLEYLKNNLVDLMILDIVMPGMDGIELLKEIRKDNRLKKIPVLFQTGMCDNKTVTDCMELHPQGYTVKPIVKKDLMSVVGSIFQKKREISICYIDADATNRAVFKKILKAPYIPNIMEGSIMTVNAINIEKTSCIIINYDNSMFCLPPIRSKLAKTRIPVILVSKNTANPALQKELLEYKTYGLPFPIDAEALNRKLDELKL